MNLFAGACVGIVIKNDMPSVPVPLPLLFPRVHMGIFICERKLHGMIEVWMRCYAASRIITRSENFCMGYEYGVGSLAHIGIHIRAHNELINHKG